MAPAKRRPARSSHIGCADAVRMPCSPLVIRFAPLLSSNCRNTSVDDDWVSELIDLKTPAPEIKTKTYVHLMRAAHAICEEPEISRLAPRTRTASGGRQPPDGAIRGLTPPARHATIVSASPAASAPDCATTGSAAASRRRPAGGTTAAPRPSCRRRAGFAPGPTGFARSSVRRRWAPCWP